MQTENYATFSMSLYKGFLLCTVLFVMMQRLPDLSGAVNMISIMISSMIERRPLAPVCLSSATLAISLIPKIGIQVCSASCLSLSLQKKGLATSFLSDYYLRESRIILFSIFNFRRFRRQFFCFPAFKSILLKQEKKSPAGLHCRKEIKHENKSKD